ncbi:AraC family transcriptional regulator [Curtobacterium sp. MCPF17_002]|uniref:AraC family transcriptional regulator n=1 Tax=Curtobacterium sp. MCPF17_002 TaxID=2175645 RepID=UPI000DA9862F|nr:AraC family transcriptional regulator [Curtobacterium sp. MCPF17_002]WIB78545.1 AraC family transcriptional regulator [Curtobacterium sp. MCPF17_002]
MGDALRALVDAAGLEARYGHEVHSDEQEWTLDLEAGEAHVWVASSTHVEAWVTCGDRLELVRPGTAALFTHRGTATIGTGPERRPPPTTGDDLFSSTGVHIGSAAFGTLAHETLGRSDFLRTQPPDAPSDGMIRALGLLGLLTNGRWHAAERDALARVVVLGVLRDNPPAFLADNGLARCIDRLSEAGDGPSTDELLDLTTGSAASLRRRFRAATGCSPDQLRRWFRSLPVRRALEAGTDRRLVAARFGFSTVRSMDRALGRVRAPEPHDPFPC